MSIFTDSVTEQGDKSVVHIPTTYTAGIPGNVDTSIVNLGSSLSMCGLYMSAAYVGAAIDVYASTNGINFGLVNTVTNSRISVPAPAIGRCYWLNHTILFPFQFIRLRIPQQPHNATFYIIARVFF
jgi:hypothetical protein